MLMAEDCWRPQFGPRHQETLAVPSTASPRTSGPASSTEPGTANSIGRPSAEAIRGSRPRWAPAAGWSSLLKQAAASW